MSFDKSGVYSITCIPTGKVYVGSSYRVYVRWQAHRYKLRQGKSPCIILQHAWTCYGEAAFAFAVLEDCPRDILEMREQHYIDTLKPELNSISDVRRRYGAVARAKIKASIVARAAARTHCPHGHEYTPENTYLSKKPGDKRCKACNRERVSAIYARETPEQTAARLAKGMANYYANHAAKRAQADAYAAAHREEKRAYDIAYRPIKNARRRKQPAPP